MDTSLEENSGVPKCTRGPTTMTKFVKRGRYDMEWNAKGQPIGEYRHQFTSYIGLRARKRAPITFVSWKKVSQEIKDHIWEDVVKVFDVPSNKKKWVVGRAGERWRDFKSRLTKMFIRNDDGSIRTKPPAEYDHISQDDWDAFVESRLTEEFQERSNVNRGFALQNDCSYRAGRKGYVGLEQEMLTERSLDPTKSSISREELWKRARVDKDGNFTDEFVKEVADKIDSLSNGASEALISDTAIVDVLSRALGKNEHPGRVRGVGRGVTITEYFGQSRADHPKSGRDKILEQIQRKLKEMQRKIDALESKNCTVPNQSLKEAEGQSVQQDEEFTQSEEEGQAPSFNQDEEPIQSEEVVQTSSLNLDEEPTQFEEDVSTWGRNQGKERPQLEEVPVLSVKNGKEHAQINDVSCAEYGKKATPIEKDVEVPSAKCGMKTNQAGKEARFSSVRKPAEKPTQLREAVELSSAKNRMELAQAGRVDQVCTESPGICLQELLTGPVNCRLMLDNPLRTVAMGRVFVTHDNLPVMLHCGTLGSNLKKVIVDTPVEPDALLPLPIEEASIVDEAVGNFVAWPVDLISLDLTALQTPPRQAKRMKIVHTKASVTQQSAQFSTPTRTEKHTFSTPTTTLKHTQLRTRYSTPTSTETHVAESLQHRQSFGNIRSARNGRAYTQRRGYM